MEQPKLPWGESKADVGSTTTNTPRPRDARRAGRGRSDGSTSRAPSKRYAYGGPRPWRLDESTKSAARKGIEEARRALADAVARTRADAA